MVYNGTPDKNGGFGGNYHYFWKQPYDIVHWLVISISCLKVHQLCGRLNPWGKQVGTHFWNCCPKRVQASNVNTPVNDHIAVAGKWGPRNEWFSITIRPQESSRIALGFFPLWGKRNWWSLQVWLPTWVFRQRSDWWWFLVDELGYLNISLLMFIPTIEVV